MSPSVCSIPGHSRDLIELARPSKTIASTSQPDLNVTSQPRQVYLFGGSISNSLSPMIHSTLFKSAGIPWTYSLCETTSPQHFVNTLHQSDSIGGSVTMPNKVAFMSTLDVLTEEAQAIGAVNTVFFRTSEKGQRVLVGTNTDCIGVRETLLNNNPRLVESIRGQPVMVIGAGGAARSAIYALWSGFQPSQIYVVNRIESEAEDLVSNMQKTIPGINLRHVSTVEDAVDLPIPRVIVGTVPDLEPRTPEELLTWKICETLLGKSDSERAFLDMCYQPPRTRLLCLAEQNGWTTMMGTEVLVRVSVAQQALWTGKEQKTEGVNEALRLVQKVVAARTS